MPLLKGIPISKGISIAKPFIRADATKSNFIKKIKKEQIPHQKDIYLKALNGLKNNMSQLQTSDLGDIDNSNQQLVVFYEQLLSSALFQKEIPTIIETEQITAEGAIIYMVKKMKKQFGQMDNEYFKNRFFDIKALADNIIRSIQGDISLSQVDHPILLLAEELSSADLLHIPENMLLGIATESGGTTSHAAFIAESLSIATVFGIHNLIKKIHEHPNKLVIIDGYKGVVIIDPNEPTIKNYEKLEKELKSQEGRFTKNIAIAAKTKDNHRIIVQANISNSLDIHVSNLYHSDGIGLVRTELAFMTKEKFLNEEEQYELYKKFFLLSKRKPVTIRTLDFGGDKFLNNQSHTIYKESNPFLGWRSIRIFLEKKDLFKEQLRAILRSSIFNENVKIMFPFVSSLEEVQELRELYQTTIEELEQEKVLFKHNVPVGIMIEIPSAAILSDKLAKEVDFFSIGTNDLIQYTLAADRNNQKIAKYYNGSNPAILELIYQVVENAKRNNISVSLCGEMGRNPLYVRLLLGMGLRHFSINPAFLPMVKTLIIESSLEDTHLLWEQVKNLNYTKEIEQILLADLKKNVPMIYDHYLYEANSEDL